MRTQSFRILPNIFPLYLHSVGTHLKFLEPFVRL